MKLAFVSRWLCDETRRFGRGPELERVQAYRDLGHEVTVLSQSPDAAWFEERTLGGIQAIVTPRWKRHFRWWAADRILKGITPHRKLATDASDLATFLDRWGPFDHVEAQCEEPDGLLLATLSHFKKLPPWSVDLFSLRYSFHQGKPCFESKRVLGEVFQRADHLKADSPLVADLLVREYGADPTKISVVPHSLSSVFLEAPPSAGPISDEILAVGALNEKKGIPIFVEAVRRNPQGRYAVAGGSTQGETFATNLRNSAHGLPIEWLGSLAPELLRERISRARVAVIPSLFDEMNRVAIEAVVCGRPVVVTDQCGAASWIQRESCGIVVPAGDPDALNQGIRDAEKIPQEAIEKAGKIFREEFHPRTVAAASIQAMTRR